MWLIHKGLVLCFKITERRFLLLNTSANQEGLDKMENINSSWQSARGGKSTNSLYLSRSTVTSVTPVKAVVLIQLLYSHKSKKVPALKCTQSKKIIMNSPEAVSTRYFCAKLPEPCVILI